MLPLANKMMYNSKDIAMTQMKITWHCIKSLKTSEDFNKTNEMKAKQVKIAFSHFFQTKQKD